MKKMNKVMATFVAPMMLVGATSVTAFAGNSNFNEFDQSVTDITVGQTATGINRFTPVAYNDVDGGAVVSVHVEWDDPSFTYEFSKTWDTEKLEYVGEDVGWSKDSMNVKFINRSNCFVKASVDFEKSEDEAFQTVTAEFDRTSAIMESAIDGEEKVYTFILNVDGTPSDYLKDASLGKITVSIGAPDEATDEETPIVPTEPDEKTPVILADGTIPESEGVALYYTTYEHAWSKGATEHKSNDIYNAINFLNVEKADSVTVCLKDENGSLVDANITLTPATQEEAEEIFPHIPYTTQWANSKVLEAWDIDGNVATLNSTKKVGFYCLKATVEYNGKTYTYWFAGQDNES